MQLKISSVHVSHSLAFVAITDAFITKPLTALIVETCRNTNSKHKHNVGNLDVCYNTKQPEVKGKNASGQVMTDVCTHW